MNKNHQIFFKEIEKFQDSFKVSIEKEQKGKKLTDKFIKLISHNIQEKKIANNNPLHSHIEQINKTLNDFISHTQKEWQNFTLSEELSKNFGDKLIFFVFGKVNAGKSSFSNLFSELSNKNSEIFSLDENNEVQSNKNSTFKVGQTETTARIQWIELDSLILVDSPGLHSITEKNAELTKKYLDSADAIIWLTSSGSPGQVQELEELAREMRKEKPILPVITKSDRYEEDYCDETNSIVKILKAKDNNNRKAQEQDVKKRAKDVLEKLNSKSTLLDPISISAQCAKEEMMEASNIEALFHTLTKEILQDAIAYKSEKPKKLLIKYFELEIIEKVDKSLLPKIHTLKSEIQKQQENLEKKKNLLQTTLLSDINFKIYSLATKYESSKNTEGLIQELNKYIAQKFNQEVSKILKELFNQIQETSIALNANSIAEYENIEFDYTVRGKKRGLWDKVTEWDWRDRNSDSTRTEVIGIDSSAVVDSLRQSSSKEIEKSIEITFNEFHLTFEHILADMSQMEQSIEKFKKDIKALKDDK
jgi:predicted GTPase